ncbi:hypothetical protein OO007_18625 [Cocleimonas sp. KMM 6892]|uniref:hypothetical protein n=1 Tax=unclassified Cocleimonas TaxID=2639732 RepID=UPI002DC011AB|nr:MULTISPECIES: hypothetical protein [unclassified Cocleimonas]MEB8434259.1 hypothetical protein [Cocleimonas sp. KMM 6892]MEC4717122.1 hypothetical protein [Cocleimonas sp. KMM 6895]MEC4746531.1 hypothetical protein [Cocleimonas sp. KMM 6896]
MSKNTSPEKQKHWLYREENRRTLWIIQFAILFIAILPEFFMHHHASFEAQGIHLDASPTFYAWYGFATCAAMVLGAKLLGYVLKRKDDYYDE